MSIYQIKPIIPAREIFNGGKHTKHGRIVQVPLEMNRRLFVPLARHTYTYEREYKKRMAVERVNSRIDGPFGMGNHYVRSKARMEMKFDLIFVIMLAMATGRVEAGQYDEIHSLLKNLLRTNQNRRKRHEKQKNTDTSAKPFCKPFFRQIAATHHKNSHLHPQK